MASSDIILLNESNFDSGVAKGVVLVDFYADWCGPCRMQTPVLEDLAKEMKGKLTIVKIDTDQSVNLAARFEVTSIPTLVLLKDAKVVKRVVGLKDIDSLRKMIKEFL